MINIDKVIIENHYYYYKNLINNNKNLIELSKYFFIIIYNLVKNHIDEFLIQKYLILLFKNGLTLYKIKNIKKTFLLLKELRLFKVYEYITLYYKKDKYNTKLTNILNEYKYSDGLIKNHFKDIKCIIKMNDIIKKNIDLVLNSFDDKRFLYNLKTNLFFIKPSIYTQKMMENEMINRLNQLTLFFGIDLLLKYNIKIIRVEEFYNYNLKMKIRYYEYCINKILFKYNMYKNDFIIYLEICNNIIDIESDIINREDSNIYNEINNKIDEIIDLVINKN